MALIDKLVITDLDEDQQVLAEAIGIEAYRKLVEDFGGTSIYIPKIERIVRHIRDDEIRKAFNGWNYTELAKRYGLSERQVRSILYEENVPGQLNLEDYLKSLEL